jgi:Ca2+-binding EF-hand superfamily protein
MQFTPQQLAGGPKFSPVTRIGNWLEELSLEEAKVGNFQTRSSNGNLALRKMEIKIAVCSEIVPHSFSEDGIIRFGDTVVLEHDNTGSVLACDPFEEVVSGQGKFLVSTVLEEPRPKARNTFRIVRPPAHMGNFDDNLNDPIVHIGQSFMLACSESLLVKPGSKLLAPALYLHSTKKNERVATKRTNRQLVYLSSAVNAEAVWLAIVPSRGRTNAAGRFLAMGQPLNIRDSFQLTHRQTNMYLTCDAKEKTSTEFGIELECYADRSTMPGKLGLMISEFKGASTSQTLAKPDAPVFSWHFLTSTDRSAAVETRSLPPPASQETILHEVQEAVKARGVDAFWNLRDFFRQFERRNLSSGKIDREDMKACLMDWGIATSFHYLDTIMDMCDDTKMGLIDVREMLSVLRGPISPRRENLIRQVFEALDKNRERVVPVSEVSANFSGAGHPLVTIGGFSEKDALNHLLKSFEVKGVLPPKIVYEKLFEYYADLSAAMEDDDYFEDVMRSNWAKLL